MSKKNKQNPKSPQQNVASSNTATTSTTPKPAKTDKKKKYHELVDQGGLVFKLELVQSVSATQMFKSNDYMMTKISKNSGLGTKLSAISADTMLILDHMRYSVLLQLHELNKTLAELSDTPYNPPSNFYESLSLEEVNAFLAKNPLVQKKEKTPAVKLATKSNKSAAPEQTAAAAA